MCTTIESTIDCYEGECKKHNHPPNQYIYEMLNKERKLSVMSFTKSERHLYYSGRISGIIGVEMSLNLAGNNKLATQTRLADSDMVALCEMLKKNHYVTSLDLRYNALTDAGAQVIAEMLKVNEDLQELNLMCNDIAEDGAQHLAKALHKNEHLQILRLNGNKMGNKGGMYFAQALQINMTLEYLDLGDTDLKTESVIALATVLRHNKSVKSLNVNRPLLFSHQEETTVHFANMLKVNSSLEELHLRKYDMRDFGVTRLAEGLFNNFHLTYLDLSCNRMTRDGAKELAKLLRNDTMLQVLNLDHNRLGDDGAKHIASAISACNTNLTHLSIAHNEIRGKGLCAIAACMTLNSTLTNVYIWGNELEQSACIAFANLLLSGRLENENVDVEHYSVDGEVFLAQQSNGLLQTYYWEPCYARHRCECTARTNIPYVDPRIFNHGG